jgi:uncharacterized membrane protein YdjX (TVP38/TMEM64 family)
MKMPGRKTILMAITVVVILIVGWLTAKHFGFGLDDLHNQIERLPLPALLVVIALFPIFGFSIGVIYLVAGSRFGNGLGMVVISVAIVIHLLVTWWITKSFLREWIQRRLDRSKHKLPKVPEGEDVSLTLLAALIPGIPYAFRNFLLAFSGVSFRVYFWVSLPIYILRATLGIFLGHLSKDFNAKNLIIFSAVIAVKLTICGALFFRIRRKLRLKKPQETALESGLEDCSPNTPAASR